MINNCPKTVAKLDDQLLQEPDPAVALGSMGSEKVTAAAINKCPKTAAKLNVVFLNAQDPLAVLRSLGGDSPMAAAIRRCPAAAAAAKAHVVEKGFVAGVTRAPLEALFDVLAQKDKPALAAILVKHQCQVRSLLCASAAAFQKVCQALAISPPAQCKGDFGCVGAKKYAPAATEVVMATIQALEHAEVDATAIDIPTLRRYVEEAIDVLSESKKYGFKLTLTREQRANGKQRAKVISSTPAVDLAILTRARSGKAINSTEFRAEIQQVSGFEGIKTDWAESRWKALKNNFFKSTPHPPNTSFTGELWDQLEEHLRALDRIPPPLSLSLSQPASSTTQTGGNGGGSAVRRGRRHSGVETSPY
jgi:hypothetical protein